MAELSQQTDKDSLDGILVISQLALETSINVKQISESSHSVSQLSEKLKLMVGQFKF